MISLLVDGGARRSRRCSDRESHAPGRGSQPLLRPGGPRAGLHGPAVLVLLLVQRLAVDLPRSQRPRGRLGDGGRLPGRRHRPVAPGVDRGFVARPPRRCVAAPLGRPEPAPRERPPRRLPGRRIAFRGVRARRLRRVGGAARPATHPRRGAAMVASADLVGIGVRDSVRGLRARRRARCRSRARPGVAARADRRRHAVGARVPGTVGARHARRVGGERAPAGPRYERTARYAAPGRIRSVGPGSTPCRRPPRRGRRPAGPARRADPAAEVLDEAVATRTGGTARVRAQARSLGSTPTPAPSRASVSPNSAPKAGCRQ